MSLFICPLCPSPLQPAADTWRCDGSLNTKQTSHCFDVARQGYVNLLPVQQKKSKAPGDSQQSIIARQRFLQAGHYQALQTLICEQMTRLLSQNAATAGQENGAVNWLDIGCGEGYYTQAMAQTGMHTLIAADISKPAILELSKASKLNRRLWSQNHEADKPSVIIYPLVTSAAHLPLSAKSITGITSIFSPILPEAFAQVLSDEGYLIIAKPDIGHLSSVREALFDEVREHNSDKFLGELEPFFEVLATQYSNTELSLSVAALSDLLTMTPYAYRAQPEKRQNLLDMADTALFKTEAKFVIYVLQKKGS